MKRQRSIGRNPLRIHPGWTVEIHSFLDLDPSEVSPDEEDIWLFIFTQDIFYIHYDEIYGVDLGWYPEADPDGRFELQLVTHKGFKTLLSVETRSLKEIVDAVDKITWGVGQGILPSADPGFSLDQMIPSIRLQPLVIHQAWTIERNRFLELDPNHVNEDQQEVWRNFTDDLLYLKGDDNEQIRLSWKPAGDPNGQYVLQVIDPTNKKNPLRTFSTRNKEEVVDWIELATLYKL